jgi:hypothetical protein
VHYARHLNISSGALAFYLSSKHRQWKVQHYAEIEAWGADRVKVCFCAVHCFTARLDCWMSTLNYSLAKDKELMFSVCHEKVN